MLQVNDVIQLDKIRYRVLSVEQNTLFWIDIDSTKGLPESLHLEQYYQLVESGDLKRVDDPYLHLQGVNPEKSIKSQKKLEEHYTLIAPIIKDSLVFYKESRSKRINQVLVDKDVSKATIYRLLRRYWQRGQIKNALLPSFSNSGASGKRRNLTENKPGRPRQFGRGEGQPVTESIRKQFRIFIDKYLMNSKGYSVIYAYDKFISAYQMKNPYLEEYEFPTIRQFRYFYKTEYNQSERAEKQAVRIEYLKDIRPLHGTATEQALGPGSRYEIDATIADIYLVDQEYPDKIIGRPTIYMVIDVFSRMIAGFYIGFDNPSYAIAMKALTTSFRNKEEACNEFGVTISEEDWPCVGLPSAVLADRGELMSHQVSYLIESLGIRLESAPPRRGDCKGIVERSFGVLQAKFKPYSPGVVTGTRIKKHGEKDYRVEATLNMKDFTEIILYSILEHNLYKPLTKYDRDVDMPTDLPSIPIELWRWGIQNRTGQLRSVDIKSAEILLLPRKKVTISEQGVKIWGVLYTSKEIIEAGWMHRNESINRPKNLVAAYDLGNTNNIYLFPENNNNTFWVCELSVHSRQFKNMTWHYAWQLSTEIKQTLSEANYTHSPARRELANMIDEKIKAAKKRSKVASEASHKSNAGRIKEIKENKGDAREKERFDTAIKPKQLKQNKAAEVIQLTPREDYSTPDYTDDLFNDDGDND